MSAKISRQVGRADVGACCVMVYEILPGHTVCCEGCGRQMLAAWEWLDANADRLPPHGEMEAALLAALTPDP